MILKIFNQAFLSDKEAFKKLKKTINTTNKLNFFRDFVYYIIQSITSVMWNKWNSEIWKSGTRSLKGLWSVWVKPDEPWSPRQSYHIGAFLRCADFTRPVVARGERQFSFFDWKFNNRKQQAIFYFTASKAKFYTAL